VIHCAITYSELDPCYRARCVRCESQLSVIGVCDAIATRATLRKSRRPYGVRVAVRAVSIRRMACGNEISILRLRSGMNHHWSERTGNWLAGISSYETYCNTRIPTLLLEIASGTIPSIKTRIEPIPLRRRWPVRGREEYWRTISRQELSQRISKPGLKASLDFINPSVCSMESLSALGLCSIRQPLKT
jgi:hypothetical protein